MRAVTYARYSSDLQSACSIEDQVRLCRARVEVEGWALVATYTDHAISGATRPCDASRVVAKRRQKCIYRRSVSLRSDRRR